MLTWGQYICGLYETIYTEYINGWNIIVIEVYFYTDVTTSCICERVMHANSVWFWFSSNVNMTIVLQYKYRTMSMNKSHTDIPISINMRSYYYQRNTILSRFDVNTHIYISWLTLFILYLSFSLSLIYSQIVLVSISKQTQTQYG